MADFVIFFAQILSGIMFGLGFESNANVESTRGLAWLDILFGVEGLPEGSFGGGGGGGFFVLVGGFLALIHILALIILTMLYIFANSALIDVVGFSANSINYLRLGINIGFMVIVCSALILLAVHLFTGKAIATKVYEIASWTMLALGVFVRQIVDFKTFSIAPDNFSVGKFVASCAIALAVFPWVMRGFAQTTTPRGLRAFAIPFSMGFFLDVARLGAMTYLPKMFGA